MTKVEIESLDTGYIINHNGRRYGKGSPLTMIAEIKSIFDITKKRTKNPVKNIEPSTPDPAPEPTDEPGPDNSTSGHGGEELHEPEPIPDPVPIFEEQDKITKPNLTKYVDINMFNMGYHDQGDDNLVLCYGTTKVYTTWKDMFALPVMIDDKSLKKLNNLKQVAVRQFRKWMSEHLNLLPDGVDPDAEFRPQLSGVIDTKPGNGGDYENTSGEYD